MLLKAAQLGELDTVIDIITQKGIDPCLCNAVSDLHLITSGHPKNEHYVNYFTTTMMAILILYIIEMKKIVNWWQIYIAMFIDGLLTGRQSSHPHSCKCRTSTYSEDFGREIQCTTNSGNKCQSVHGY